MNGYNEPGSSTWHQDQRCSGTVFSAAAQMSLTVAQNRGLRPCGNCCGGTWPDRDDD